MKRLTGTDWEMQKREYTKNHVETNSKNRDWFDSDSLWFGKIDVTFFLAYSLVLEMSFFLDTEK